jgi:hypothetical protein
MYSWDISIVSHTESQDLRQFPLKACFRFIKVVRRSHSSFVDTETVLRARGPRNRSSLQARAKTFSLVLSGPSSFLLNGCQGLIPVDNGEAHLSITGVKEASPHAFIASLCLFLNYHLRIRSMGLHTTPVGNSQSLFVFKNAIYFLRRLNSDVAYVALFFPKQSIAVA